jgi:cell division protein ZapE
MIKNSMLVLNLSAPVDYRFQDASSSRTRLFWPIDSGTDSAIRARFARLCPNAREHLKVSVLGRQVEIEEGCKGEAALIDAKAMLSGHTSAADFLAIARDFPVIFMVRFPDMNAAGMRDEIRRLILFVDQLYEHRTTLYLQSASDPEKMLLTIQRELVIGLRGSLRCAKYSALESFV